MIIGAARSALFLWSAVRIACFVARAYTATKTITRVYTPVQVCYKEPPETRYFFEDEAVFL